MTGARRLRDRRLQPRVGEPRPPKPPAVSERREPAPTPTPARPFLWQCLSLEGQFENEHVLVRSLGGAAVASVSPDQVDGIARRPGRDARVVTEEPGLRGVALRARIRLSVAGRQVTAEAAA